VRGTSSISRGGLPGRLFRALDADRGKALPYWLECRNDDDDTPRLAAARGIGQVEPLGVHPEFTRRGVGEALLGELLARFRGHGASLARVETEPGNFAAIGAYQRAGFRVAHAVRAYGKLFGP
jgi:ribosomal protein S18 acetylase RimI-like enzyme